jgi:hypothetical protein
MAQPSACPGEQRPLHAELSARARLVGGPQVPADEVGSASGESRRSRVS